MQRLWLVPESARRRSTCQLEHRRDQGEFAPYVMPSIRADGGSASAEAQSHSPAEGSAAEEDWAGCSCCCSSRQYGWSISSARFRRCGTRSCKARCSVSVDGFPLHQRFGYHFSICMIEEARRLQVFEFPPPLYLTLSLLAEWKPGVCVRNSLVYHRLQSLIRQSLLHSIRAHRSSSPFGPASYTSVPRFAPPHSIEIGVLCHRPFSAKHLASPRCTSTWKGEKGTSSPSIEM